MKISSMVRAGGWMLAGMLCNGVAGPVPAAAQPAAGAPLPWAGEETVEVELRTVPFYAVDADGRPVYDLAPEELRLTVDGEPVPLDTFDRYRTGEAPAPQTAAPGAPALQSLARHVFLLFDQAFSSDAGLGRSREAAAELLDRLPASDRLYLLANHSQTGFQQLLGPLAADAAGKAAIRARIDTLLPNIERLRTNAEADLPPMQVGARNPRGAPGEQVHNFYDHIGGLGRIEYRGAAETFAAGLETLASHLRQVAEAKLLVVFSEGVMSRMYFDGDAAGEGLGGKWTAGTSGLYHVDQPRFPAIRHRFEGPLKELAAAGAMTVFVNASGDGAAGRNAVHHMSEVTGGLFVDNRNPAFIEEKVAAATSAYYVAGFYVEPGEELREAARVEVEVLRPGVSVYSPARLQRSRVYRGLGRSEKEYLVADLVYRGLEGPRRAGGTAGVVEELAGRVGSKPMAGKRHLLFEGWPAEGLEGKDLDLYNVLIEVEPGGGQPQLVKLERQALAPAGPTFLLSTELPVDSAYIWGIVVVEPASGATYFRRLLLEAPLVTAEAASRGRQEGKP